MSEHTPGPWHWDCDAVKGDPLSRVRYRVTAKGKTITQLYYSSDDPHAEQDAMLIASAPALREEVARLRGALETITRWAEDVTKDWATDDDSELEADLRMIQSCKAALTQGKGGGNG